VIVGPFAVIGGWVRVGSGTRIGPHAVVDGETEIGEDNEIGPHVVVGSPPQIRDCSRPGGLHIGRGNQLREFVTVHCGGPSSSTVLGNDNLLMAYSHVAHDCCLGDGIELANGVQLGGHVEVGDRAVLGGVCAVHQHVRVGSHSVVGGGSIVVQDVLPFCQVAGDRARLYGLNVVGLRRAGFSAEQRRALGGALRLLRGAPTHRAGLAAVRGSVALMEVEAVRRLLDFAEGPSSRGLCRPVRSAR
jgi:UDP-N-acetylglucosamine acyltransferase